MDYRAMDKQAEELRAVGADLAAKGEAILPEDRDTLMKITGKLEELDRLRVEARDAEIAEARAISNEGRRIGETAEADKQAAAFRSYIRSGAEDRATLIAGTDANGGFVVPEPLHAPLIEKFRKLSPLLEDVTIFNMSGDTSMYLPRKDTHGVVANATETGARSQQTEPTFTNGTLQAFDLYTDQRASQQFLDSVEGAEAWITESIYGDFAEKFQSQLATGAGTGSQQAAGIYAATSTYSTQLSGAAGALSNTSFLSTFFALPQKFRANAKWYLSPATLASVIGFAYPNLNNTPLVENRNGAFYILGKPVVEVDDAPAIGAANFPVAFGDLKQGYAAGIHKNVSILRDPYTAAPNVRFYGLGRMGGTPWNKDAVILLKSNNS
jgi:HK97 family phage major capsid protein